MDKANPGIAVRYAVVTILITALNTLSHHVLASDDAVLDLLKGYEWRLQEDKLQGIGPDAYKSLLNIADDADQLNFIRARAALALTMFPNDEVWDFYEREITLGQNRIRRRQLVQNFCTSFLQLRPYKVELALMPLLKESDARLRSNSARCLQKLDSEQVRNALASYRRTISESWELRAAGFNMKHEK